MVDARLPPQAVLDPLPRSERPDPRGATNGRPSRSEPWERAEVSGEQIAKTVLLADRVGYALAIIPKSRRIDLAALYHEFGRRLRLATREEVLQVFRGKPPLLPLPVGGIGRSETFLEQSLVKLTRVFLETADLRRLVPIDGDTFRDLFYGAWCGPISRADD